MHSDLLQVKAMFRKKMEKFVLLTNLHSQVHSSWFPHSKILFAETTRSRERGDEDKRERTHPPVDSSKFFLVLGTWNTPSGGLK